MLPIGLSGGHVQREPWWTGGLILLTLAVAVHVALLRDSPLAPYCTDLTESEQALRRAAGSVQSLVCRYGAVPDELRRGEAVHALVTATFVHVGWLHLGGNLVFLAAFAPRVEAELGGPALLALYVGGGAAGTLAHVLVAPESVAPTIGGSGGLATVMGAHLLLAPQSQVRVLVAVVPVRLPSWFVIGLWGTQQAVFAAVTLSRAGDPGSTAFEAHVAGLLLGAAMGGAVRAHRWNRAPAPPLGRGG